MAENVVLWEEAAVDCRDPECVDENGRPNQAEPDGDGDHRMFECGVCGYVFGYERVPQDVIAMDSEGSCSIGVPAEIRKAASKGMTDAMAAAEPQLPLLQIGRRPE